MATVLPDDSHFEQVLEAIREDYLVAFFGAGVNLAQRPQGTGWAPGSPYLPSGAELSQLLAAITATRPMTIGICSASPSTSRWKAGPDRCTTICGKSSMPTSLHAGPRVLCPVARPAAAAKLGQGHLLIVTTNYDDLMERSLTAAGESFDVVTYMADGDDAGKFRHYPPDGPSVLIDRPNEYRGVSLDQRHVVLKIHGAVDRVSPEGDSYVITEDHYIDYLTRTDLANLVPATIAAVLRNRHFLFLGYSLRDWNLRVILHRIWVPGS